MNELFYGGFDIIVILFGALNDYCNALLCCLRACFFGETRGGFDENFLHFLPTSDMSFALISTVY